MVLRDGIGQEEVVQSGANIPASQNPYFTGSVTATTGIKTLAGGANFTGSGVFSSTVADVTGRLSTAGTGSPTTWGRLIQAGSGATGGGSNVWVSFGTAFGGVPQSVVASQAETAEAVLVEAGSVGAGSFYVETPTASQTFFWQAVGPA